MNQKIPLKNQKRIRDFVKSQKPNKAVKPPKLNNLISKESPQGRGAPLPQQSESSAVLPSSHLDVESQAFQSQQVRSTSDILQQKLINRWLNKNVIVQKRLFLQARNGNIKDEYFFEKKVGQGGFGVVYKAKNRLTQKRVAIKAVHKSKITDMTGFIREYQILSKLDHPNILNIREIWEWEKMLFIVTDYCQGGDLFAFMLERNKLTESEVSLLLQ